MYILMFFHGNLTNFQNYLLNWFFFNVLVVVQARRGVRVHGGDTADGEGKKSFEPKTIFLEINYFIFERRNKSNFGPTKIQISNIILVFTQNSHLVVYPKIFFKKIFFFNIIVNVFVLLLFVCLSNRLGITSRWEELVGLNFQST